MDKRIQNEITHGKFIAKHGEQIWNWSSPAGKKRWQRRINLFVEKLGTQTINVLEIGCGTGLFTQEIAKTPHKITAIDISDDLLNIAKQRITTENVCFLNENAYQTTFADNNFDAIIGSSVLHHLDINKALSEFHRILKNKGFLLFTEPNMLNPQIALQKNIPYLKRKAGDSPDETAFIRWRLKKKLTQNSFYKIEITAFDFLHPAIPKCLLPIFEPVALFSEKIPLVKEISGSLIVYAQKSIQNKE